MLAEYLPGILNLSFFTKGLVLLPAFVWVVHKLYIQIAVPGWSGWEAEILPPPFTAYSTGMYIVFHFF